MYDEFLSKAQEFIAKDIPFATATVVRAEKPTSAKPGDKAIVTFEKVMHGWIGGSCAQPLVIEEAIKSISDGKPRLIRLSVAPQDQRPREGLIDLPMTCFSGGTLEIYIESHLPQTKLMVVGGLPVAMALVKLGKLMNYQVVVVDPDGGGAATPEADEVLTDLEVMNSRITPLTYVVVASHGNYDELALKKALPSQAAFVALVASSARAVKVKAYLESAGLTKDQISSLKYPAGLDIQAQRGDEIALSIMAEIVQHRRNSDKIDFTSWKVNFGIDVTSTGAIDPVCGMSINIQESEHRHEHGGLMYYFCCESCKDLFTQAPEKYLEQPAPQGDAIDPVCKMTVDITTAKYMSEHQNIMYYFCCAGCKMSFEETPSKYLDIPNLDAINTST
jgi:xanthine dehydrogenase accessory factor